MPKQTTSEMTMELQFLEHHKKEYLELSTDFASISFMPKSRPALENMKKLVLLDLKILLGADIPWAHVALSNESLGNPPSTGPNAFSDEERDWCKQTRRFFSAGGGSRAACSPSGEHGRRRAPS